VLSSNLSLEDKLRGRIELNTPGYIRGGLRRGSLGGGRKRLERGDILITRTKKHPPGGGVETTR